MVQFKLIPMEIHGSSHTLRGIPDGIAMGNAQGLASQVVENGLVRLDSSFSNIKVAVLD